MIPESLPAAPLFALLSAVLFGLSINLVRKGLDTVDPVSGTLLSIYASTLITWLVSPGFVRLEYFLSPAVLIFAAVGIFRPFITANLSTRATQILGPTITQTVASISPLFSVLGGVLLLGEEATLPLLAGAITVVGGVVVLSWRGRTPRSWSKMALLLPIGTAALRSAGHVAAKFGLLILPVPYMAALVANSVSLALGVTEYGARARWRSGRSAARGALWFMGSGLINGGSVLSLNYGLQAGQVSVVAPIVAASPLFTLLFSHLLFRQERITLQSVLGMALIVPGVVLVSVFH